MTRSHSDSEVVTSKMSVKKPKYPKNLLDIFIFSGKYFLVGFNLLTSL